MVFKAFVHFAQAHSEFRLPELFSVAELFDFQIHRTDSDNWNSSRPFWIIELQDEKHAFLLAERCILIKSIFELHGKGSTYAEVHKQNQENKSLWSSYIENTSFRFTVTGYNRTISKSRQKDIVESFSYMDLKGEIDLSDNVKLTLSCFEEYGTDKYNAHDPQIPVEIFFGRLVAKGTARALIRKFDVKKRAYYGNTSMDSEISLLMANQSLASKGKLIYDPFVGTGSMAYTVAYFGAQFIGSDIDGRQMRGKHAKHGIFSSADQYGVGSKIIGLFTFDVTQNPWRRGDIFDAIVTDPPYGVRAGAKCLGRKNPLRRLKNRSPQREQQSQADQNYIPPTKPYELSKLIFDLVRLARFLLKPDGRLVFFLPTVTEEYEEIDILSFLCEGMTIIGNSLQNFGNWGRRLVTIKKSSSQSFPSPFEIEAENSINKNEHENQRIPAHQNFRDKYFNRFQKGHPFVNNSCKTNDG